MPAVTKPLMSRDEVSLRWKLEMGRYIRELRENLGLTQMEVGEAVGWRNKQMLSAIECGRSSIPPESQNALADALGVVHAEFAKNVLRYSNPWMFAALFGADKRLEAELLATQDRVNQRRGPRKRTA